ncbi:MAG TPA: acyl-CoA dehydrogenase family protein [Caulobacteraceae bacterium]|nr:acyl-CoA dehydrogenase family protein [Caulobacteraceae bacterium]
MADFGPEVEAFRAEARDWLAANFPPALRADPAAQLAPATGGTATPEAALWSRRMGEKGWGTPTWPAAYGGGGLTPEQARALAEEMAAVGARNPIGGMGVMMFGPTLLEVGTEDQKRRHIPPIVRGEIRWCQGYSEPGAGSDLASLQTRCEDKGDHWLINGQKVWTSGANLADWCFCLVRTDPARKHDGISFMLIDMRTPGVETRPIRLINGASPFCETFFTDVKVPKENLMGPLNGGWTIAKRLLQFERENISASLGAGGSPALGQTGGVDALALERRGTTPDGRLAAADLRRRLAEHRIDARAFQLTTRRASLEASANQGPTAATSIMKYAGAKIAQDRAELAVEAMGGDGLGWEGENFAAADLALTRAWLRSKANSIEGGTSEINLNVVAKRVLGLPDPR